jgi:dTDP-4-dehydrorhamnose 3,5-epimerase
MIFEKTTLDGAFLIIQTPAADERGFFARTYCEDEFGEAGLETRFVQHSLSYNAKSGTLRGLHLQREPHAEVKFVGCTRGAIYDVIVDMRPHSPTYRQWQGFELTAENRNQLYIPRGFAHGFQTLCNDTEVRYLISDLYVPAAASGYRWNDPALSVRWPMRPTAMSDKDRVWPLIVPVSA